MTHLALVLYAGDYRDASQRRAEGLPDRYRHHSYALAALDSLHATGSRVTVIQMRAPAAYDEVHDGVRMLGLTPASKAEAAAAIGEYVAREGVTHVMVRFPSPEVLGRLADLDVRVSVVLADSFPSPWRHRAVYAGLATALDAPQVDFVANHQLNSSRQLVRVLGLPPERVVPWDWPLDLSEVAATSAKQRPATDRLSICYAGSISRTKGVWDLVEALGILRSRGQQVGLEVAGSGDLEELRRRAERAGLSDAIQVHGRIGGDEVLAMMQRSAFVCVPSLHRYPEGLPLTLYEAMASGTPLVASDHPMFTGVVRDGETAFVFRAGSGRRLARAVLRGWGDPEAYAHVSRTAAAAYPAMGLGTEWGELLNRWVHGSADDQRWLQERTLARLDQASRPRS